MSVIGPELSLTAHVAIGERRSRLLLGLKADCFHVRAAMCRSNYDYGCHVEVILGVSDKIAALYIWNFDLMLPLQ